MPNNKKKGLTIIEVIIIIFLVTIVSTIVFNNLSSFKKEQVLRNTTNNVITFLNKAKQNTLSSINSSAYGVHFDSDKMVLFAGGNYSDSDPNNEIVYFDDSVSIPSVGGLNIGGSNDVIFERLTGDTTGGTIKIQLNSDNNKYRIINISKTGLISLN